METRYREIAGEIRDRIVSGALRPGDRIPSTRQITRSFGVAIATATKVHAMLREEGLVESRPRVGAVVTHGAVAAGNSTAASANSAASGGNSTTVSGNSAV